MGHIFKQPTTLNYLTIPRARQWTLAGRIWPIPGLKADGISHACKNRVRFGVHLSHLSVDIQPSHKLDLLCTGVPPTQNLMSHRCVGDFSLPH